MQLKPLSWYWVSLQQDWTICQLIEYNDCGVMVDFYGFYHVDGAPVHRAVIRMSNFLDAYRPSPDGDWTRQYHPEVKDGELFVQPIKDQTL
jgi:hypothetical protein